MNLRLILLTLLLLSTSIVSYPETETITDIKRVAIATLHVPGFADFLVADGEAVWATNEGRVEKLQQDQPKPVASVSITNPCGAMAIAFESLWVADCKSRSINRIDTKSARVSAIIPTGLADPEGELSLGAGAGSVWILTDSKGVLSRIDPKSNKVIAKISVAPYSYAAVFGFNAVWITNTGKDTTSGSVQRIDPQTNRVVATIPVGPVPRFLAAGEGGIWTLNQGDGSVSRIDPSTNTVVASIPVRVQGSGGDIATGNGRVWVRATKVLLSVIDPKTNQIKERFGPPAGSGAVRVANGLVWVSAHDIQTLWVLRP